MKVTLEFYLPEDQIQFNRVSASERMHNCLRGFEHELTKALKHRELTPEQRELYMEIKDIFYTQINTYNINLD
jgi:hypothetical protein